jgi:hypothetical protein
MKKSLIIKGKTYTDGKGSIRKVIDIGPQYVLYRGQQCDDNLVYRLLRKIKGPNVVGNDYNSTRASFAAWANEELIRHPKAPITRVPKI